jgi:hypothetical protein
MGISPKFIMKESSKAIGAAKKRLTTPVKFTE